MILRQVQSCRHRSSDGGRTGFIANGLYSFKLKTLAQGAKPFKRGILFLNSFFYAAFFFRFFVSLLLLALPVPFGDLLFSTMSVSALSSDSAAREKTTTS